VYNFTFCLEVGLSQSLSICSDKCKKVYVLCTELIFFINGAKAYVKNPRVLHREKSAKRGFYEIF
jgi:hypothetical protein